MHANALRGLPAAWRARRCWPWILLLCAAGALAEFGSGGAVAELVLGYCLAALCFLPATPLDLACGAHFGLGWGILWAHLAATLAAAVAFLASRHLLRERASRLLPGDGRLQRLRALVERHGGSSVVLARLSPFLPFSALSWLFGASRVSFRVHLLATFFATLPKTVLYVFLGASAGRLLEPRLVVTVLALLSVVGLACVLARLFVRRAQPT